MGDRPPIFELAFDGVVMRLILEKMIGRKWIESDEGKAAISDKQSREAHWNNLIEFCYRMGYDYINVSARYNFISKHRYKEDTAELSKGDRAWMEETKGLIENWEDFQNYPWPKLEDVNFFPLEHISAHLPDGMKMIVSHGGGPLEWLVWILSVQGLSILLYDNPELVGAVMNKIGNSMVRFCENIVEVPNICAILQADDMGFKTSTIISPKHLLQYILPWHKRFAQIAHAKNLSYFLHSCGNIEEIMDPPIKDVRIDGKHSFEDAIISAPEFKRKYDSNIAILGGVDVGYLSRHSPDEVRRYVRKLIDDCAAGGRFADGTGNSVANYIPVKNYLTMLDEALK